MNQKKILVTGITGFIGSHIAEALLQVNYDVIGLIRRNSDCWRCVDSMNKITWVNTEDNYIEKLIALKPDIIIHCAWEGAAAEKREDIHIQTENVLFLQTILDLAVKLKVEKFIGLGSQAEYGFLSKPVKENAKLNPDSEYGKAKALASENVRFFCEPQEINWFWLRLFSFYGPKEATNWFIPHIITSFASNNEEIKLSAGTQKYAYLYIKDLVKYLIKLVETKDVQSGIFNISGTRAVELRQIVLDIKKQFETSTTDLQFGAVPSRENQSKILRGVMSKFHKNVGKINRTSFSVGLKETIKYYQNKIHESI
jgi:nucleoside-diphosphate-sugar epimerase